MVRGEAEPDPFARRYSDVLEAIPDTVALTDEHGVLLWVCPNVHWVLGWTAAEAAALRTIDALLGAGIHDAVRAAPRGQVHNLRWRGYARSGSAVSLLVTTVSVDIAGAARLWTCREAEGLALAWRELEASAALREQVFRNLAEAVLVLEPGGRTIREANPAAERIFGYPAAALHGTSIERLFSDPRELAALHDEQPVPEPPAGTRRPRCTLHDRNGRGVLAELVVSELRPGQGWDGGVVLVVRDITRVEAAFAELRESRERLRQVAARMQAVREQDRAAVSREIHDEVGQALTRLKLDVNMLAKRLDGGGDLQAAQQRVASMAGLLDDTLTATRDLAARLRPRVLDDLGLEAAVEWYARDFERRTGCLCELTLEAGPLDFDEQRDTAVFRICQEALTNVARHAGASRVQVTLRTEGGLLTLVVQDDGRGVAPETLRGTSSLGVSGMYERAEALGGTLRIERPDAGGTRVVASVPGAPVA